MPRQDGWTNRAERRSGFRVASLVYSDPCNVCTRSVRRTPTLPLGGASESGTVARTTAVGHFWRTPRAKTLAPTWLYDPYDSVDTHLASSSRPIPTLLSIARVAGSWCCRAKPPTPLQL